MTGTGVVETEAEDFTKAAFLLCSTCAAAHALKTGSSTDTTRLIRIR